MKNITGRAVDMNDGLFEVTLVHTPTNPIEVNEIIQALLNGAETSLVEKVKAKRVTIDSAEEIAWTLDGEYGEAHTHVEIENRHKELQLFLNRRKPVKLVSPNN
jgi:diacylglycerol kinase family enzyme